MLLSMRSAAFALFAAACLSAPTPAQVASFPFFDSFEDPALGSAWYPGGDQDAVVQVSSKYPAAAGSQQLELTTKAADGLAVTNVDLMIDLEGQKGVRLKFSHRRTNGGSFNNSGVYLSDDGLNYFYVKSLETLETGEEYDHYTLDLDKLAEANGLTFNDHFRIRFLWSGWPGEAFAFGAAYDDVRVVPANFSQLDVFNSTAPIGLGNFGQALVAVTDVDGDGVRDLAVGHPGYSLKRGRVELYSGASGKYLWALQKGIFGERMGESLANLGDQDGDGFDELLVGAPSNDIGFTDAGAVYVVNSKTGAFLAELHGTAEGEAFGAILSEVPDQDGDGKADFLVSAPGATSGPEGAGRVNLFSSIDNTSAAVYAGSQLGEGLGGGLGWVEDLNGDGRAELLLGAPGYDATSSGSNEGAVFAYSTTTSVPLFTLTGPEPGAFYGAALMGLEDLDADGLAEVAVGMPMYKGGRGALWVQSLATSAVLKEVLGEKFTDHLGASVASAGQADGFGGSDIATGTDGTGAGYVRLIGLPGLDDIGLVDAVDKGTGFGAAIADLGDVNGDSLSDLATGAPLEVLGASQETGSVFVSTLAKGPVVLSVDGVHSTLAGEAVLHGANLLAGTTVTVDGQEVQGTSISVNELRVPLGVDQPGGFKTLEVSSALGASLFPGGLPRYPALDGDASLPLGEDLEVRLAGGEPGAYVLAFSNQVYATPAPFEAFGWYYGLELNGVWIAAAGLFTPGDTTRTFKLPGTNDLVLVGTDFYLQAWTSQSLLGLAGFSNTVKTTITAGN